jgi:hypothetical protein
MSQLFTAGKTRDGATCEDWALWEREASLLDRKWLKEQDTDESVYWQSKMSPAPEFACDDDDHLMELAPQ